MSSSVYALVKLYYSLSMEYSILPHHLTTFNGPNTPTPTIPTDCTTHQPPLLHKSDQNIHCIIERFIRICRKIFGWSILIGLALHLNMILLPIVTLSKNVQKISFIKLLKKNHAS